MDYISIAQQHVADLYPIISYQNPAVNMLPPGAIIGTWQYSIPHKMRFILAPEMELATGTLPGDVARAWIKDQYKLPIRRRRDQLVRGYPVPLYAKRGVYGRCGYVDIKSAYLHVLSAGYNLEYLSNKFLEIRPMAVPQQIIDNKFCYSIAVAMSATAISNIHVMGRNGVFIHRPMNIFSNPCLFNLAQDTLNGIGAMVLSELGSHCHYANTDGYIVDEDYIDKTVDLIRQWGFDARLKHYGDTVIRGVASYVIGTKSTRRFDLKTADFKSKLMPSVEWHWLLKRWGKLSPHLTSLYKSEQNHNNVYRDVY